MSSSVLRKPGLSAPPSHGGCTSSQPHPQDRLRRRSPHLQSWPGRQLLRGKNALRYVTSVTVFGKKVSLLLLPLFFHYVIPKKCS